MYCVFNDKKGARGCRVIEKFMGELEAQFGLSNVESIYDVTKCLLKIDPNIFDAHTEE